MQTNRKLFEALELDINKKDSLQHFALAANVSIESLIQYDQTNTLPVGEELSRICTVANVLPEYVMLKMGVIDSRLKYKLAQYAKEICSLFDTNPTPVLDLSTSIQKRFETDLGRLYQGDALQLLRTIDDSSIDLVFADPPFNLNKQYESGITDNRDQIDYLQWCEEWSYECARVLKPGGSLFIWNLPKWNIHIAEYLKNFLNFRNWIAVDMKYGLPIKNRLYPSHYSLAYFCKGERPKTFRPDRLPMIVCPNCAFELKDYGGYKMKMNSSGINLTDVWLDIPPVRHAKYKKRTIGNELSIKLMDRIIEMSSLEGDLVFDPFAGSGTTLIVSEIKKRRWIGIELGSVHEIIDRFENIATEQETISKHRGRLNRLFTADTEVKRRKNGFWLPNSISEETRNYQDQEQQLELFVNLSSEDS